MAKQYLVMHTNGNGRRYVREMTDSRKPARFPSREAAEAVADDIRRKGEQAEVMPAPDRDA